MLSPCCKFSTDELNDKKKMPAAAKNSLKRLKDERTEYYLKQSSAVDDPARFVFMPAGHSLHSIEAGLSE